MARIAWALSLLAAGLQLWHCFCTTSHNVVLTDIGPKKPDDEHDVAGSVMLLQENILVSHVKEDLKRRALLSPPVDAYIITANATHILDDLMKSTFGSIRHSEPVFLDWSEVEAEIKDGRIMSTYATKHHGALVDGLEDESLRDNVRKRVGLLHAHRKVWEHLVHNFETGSGPAWAAVFEEDAILDSHFRERAIALQSKLSSVNADLVLMGHCWWDCPEWPGPGDINLGGDVFLTRSTLPVCMHGYLLSARGARIMLQHTLPIQTHMDETIKSLVRIGLLNESSVCPSIVTQPDLTGSDAFAPAPVLAPAPVMPPSLEPVLPPAPAPVLQ